VTTGIRPIVGFIINMGNTDAIRPIHGILFEIRSRGRKLINPRFYSIITTKLDKYKVNPTDFKRPHTRVILCIII
jgi:hypothetical protein